VNPPPHGSIVIAIPPGGKPHWRKLNDDSSNAPPAPTILDEPWVKETVFLSKSEIWMKHQHITNGLTLI
jgi:hypothetical protein